MTIQPHFNGELAADYLLTTIGDDLFQLLCWASEISPFVKRVFCRYPEQAARMLKIQAKLSSQWPPAAKADDALELDLVQDKKLFFQQLSEQFNGLSRLQTGLNAAGELGVSDGDINEADFMRDLRIIRLATSAAIAVMELNQRLPIEISCARISYLADFCITLSAEWAKGFLTPTFGTPMNQQQTQEQNLLILAMGKLGGFELNFSSDIDLIFFFAEEGETRGGKRHLSNSRYFQKLGALIIRLLDEKTAEGFVYRVDMRLRPYGDAGALAASLAQAEDYYQEQGREWERFAMVRARLITGNQNERDKLAAIIRPFCFRRYIDYGVIDSIRDMKAMILREVKRRGLVGDIKLGAGGIRELEFIVQSLQLIQGGRDKRLRNASLFKVLPLLAEEAFLSPADAERLTRHYRFLRRLEHCLQELDEQQTQKLPQNPEEQAAVLKVFKVADWQSFCDSLTQVQLEVHRQFEALFGEERKKRFDQDEFYRSLAEGHETAETLYAKLNPQQTADLSLEQAQIFIDRLTVFTHDASISSLSSKGSNRLGIFFPALLKACLMKPSAEVVLERLLRVLQAILKRTAYLELLGENPPILNQLVDLAGTSEWVARRLSAYPVLLDELLYPNSLYEPLAGNDLRAELRQTMLRVDEDDEELVLDTLRGFKQINELRLAAALLTEKLSISQVSRYLTQLAEVILEAALVHSWHFISRQYGVPEGLADSHDSRQADSPESESARLTEMGPRYGFGIVGYGKLGGEELGFGSDLDLVFLFDQPISGSTNGKRQLNNSRFYTRLAQKIIHFLSTRTNQGLLYEVDMRLRPSGSSGLLVSHVDAYRDYQEEAAWTWEHQALIRARCVAGDQSVAQEFSRVRHQVLNKPLDPEQLKTDVKTMRAKMRQQLEQVFPEKIDLKQSPGGLVDIEFLVQYLMLSLEPEETIPHNTVAGIKLAQAKGCISQAEGKDLAKCYRQFRNRLNEIALMGESGMVDKKEVVEPMQRVQTIWQKFLS